MPLKPFNYTVIKTQVNFSYASSLLQLTIPPLLEYGIGLEAHGQNIVARICIKTLAIKGFAVRDFGGIRFHIPTLNSQGFFLNSIPAGSAITSVNLRDVRDKVHHSLIQNHLGMLIVSLHLDEMGGWAIVRDELKKVIRPDESEVAKELYQYFFDETMFFKCFLRMKMEGKYRDVSGQPIITSFLNTDSILSSTLKDAYLMCCSHSYNAFENEDF